MSGQCLGTNLAQPSNPNRRGPSCQRNSACPHQSPASGSRSVSCSRPAQSRSRCTWRRYLPCHPPRLTSPHPRNSIHRVHQMRNYEYPKRNHPVLMPRLDPARRSSISFKPLCTLCTSIAFSVSCSVSMILSVASLAFCSIRSRRSFSTGRSPYSVHAMIYNRLLISAQPGLSSVHA